ncbi:MAG: DUF2934 domain-containing protein [Gammaproteobacteria bacterium]|nr:DUF2934 domain-containing protein [Gammaproteobacteria bacterium]
MRKSETQSSRDKPKSASRSEGGSPVASGMNTEQRWEMIAEAAYFMAEHRGFNGGDPVQDWLTAESEIDALYSTRPATAEEASAYARLREEVRKALSQVQDVVDAAAVKGAFERGVSEVKRLENYSAEVMHKVAAALREDMARTAERMGPTWEHFSERSGDLFSVWKDRSRSFLNRSAEAVRAWLRHERQGREH